VLSVLPHWRIDPSPLPPGGLNRSDCFSNSASTIHFAAAFSMSAHMLLVSCLRASLGIAAHFVTVLLPLRFVLRLHWRIHQADLADLF